MFALELYRKGIALLSLKGEVIAVVLLAWKSLGVLSLYLNDWRFGIHQQSSALAIGAIDSAFMCIFALLVASNDRVRKRLLHPDRRGLYDPLPFRFLGFRHGCGGPWCFVQNDHEAIRCDHLALTPPAALKNRAPASFMLGRGVMLGRLVDGIFGWSFAEFPSSGSPEDAARLPSQATPRSALGPLFSDAVVGTVSVKRVTPAATPPLFQQLLRALLSRSLHSQHRENDPARQV